MFLDEEEYLLKEKNLLLAYFLWLFFGFLGTHRFYTHQNHVCSYLFLLAIATLTIIFYFGFFIYAVILLWWLMDGLNLYQIVKQHNKNIKDLAVCQKITL